MIIIHKYRQLFILFAILFANHIEVLAQENKTDSISVLETTNKFLNSFRNLEWDNFTGYFAEEVTVFFPPSSKFPYRTNNKTEAMNIFKTVFENAHKRKSIAPYLDIDPKDIRIQVSGKTAIVTFTLNDPDLLSRRTLIWEKRNGKWMIIHLHASGMPLSEM